MTFALVPFRQLGGARFSGTGVVTHVVRDRGLLAIASYPEQLMWVGRNISDGREFCHRVALYDDRERRIAMLEHDEYPIRDLAFHPGAPELVIGTGSYHRFEGRLLIWNWETGALRSVLSGTCQVVRVEYRDNGRRLAILVQQPASEKLPYGKRTFATVLDDLTSREGDSVDPRLHELSLSSPESIGLSPRQHDASEEVARLGLVSGALIWDLAWDDDGHLVVARDDDRVELWRSTADTPQILHTDGEAVQLLRHPDGLLVNAFAESPDDGPRRSILYAVREETLAVWHEFSSMRACSIDMSGRILARDIGPLRTPDRVLGRDATVVLDAELGSYDYLRIDGASELYFLRIPKGQTPRMVLHGIDGDLAVREVMPWDAPAKATHRRGAPSGSAVLVDGDLVRAYCAYDPDGARSILLERCQLALGVVVWSHPVAAAVAALAAWPAARCVVFSLTDGTLGALDAETGAVLHHERFMLDGQRAVVTALAVHDEAIALGTNDGRLSIFALR